MRHAMIVLVAVCCLSVFTQCQTAEEVIAALLSDQTPAQAIEQLDWMRSEIMRYVAGHAQIVAAEPDLPPRPSNEAALSLTYLQPKRRRR